MPPGEVAVIGDMSNDLSMFNVAGLAIAMGNAAAEILASADFITSSNTEDECTRAVTDYILPRARAMEEPHETHATGQDFPTACRRGRDARHA
jgi:3-deoxy-D-manno-octulosonate 8-phosphate phosphatase KdsC-like HAD superfamily phosphatase